MDTHASPNLRHNLFFLLMLCFAAAILGDSTAEALLLARFGPSFIPRMFLVNAAVLFILSVGMLSVVDRLDRVKFFFNALFVHGLILLLVRGAVAAGWDFLFLPLFSYAYSSKILFFLLFWTIANDLIDSRSAGKEFPAIAAGGTVGAIVVSFSIPSLMRFIAVENLLILWVLLATGAGLMLLPFRRHYRQHLNLQRSRTSSHMAGFNFSLPVLIREEPLLRSMSMLYFLVFFLLLNQHLIFYKEIKSVYSSAGEIAAFLGGFNGCSMLSTCLLQVGVAGMLMRRLGSTRSLLLLPSVLLGVFIIMMVISGMPGTEAQLFFWTVVIGMGIRVAFFDAFFSPNFQLFFSGLPREIRGRGKLLIEGIVKPMAMVVAGCWLLWCVPRLGMRTHLTVLIVGSAAALFFAVRLKNAYAKTLTRYLTGFSTSRNTALLERLDFTGGRDILSFLAEKLGHEDFEVRKFLVEIIASAGSDEAAAILMEYLDHPEGKLRATVVAALGNFPESLVAERLTTCLNDTDHRVVANAVEALSRCKANDLTLRLKPLLAHPNGRVRVNTIRALWAAGDRVKRDQYLDLLYQMIYGNCEEDCASALFVTGEIPDEKVIELLFGFCRMAVPGGFRSPEIHYQAVHALGKKNTPAAMELLLQLAVASSRRERLSIVEVLATLLPFLDEKCWRDGIAKGNAIHRNCVLQSLHRAKVSIAPETADLFNRIAGREIEAIEWEKQSLQTLSSSISDRMVLLACAIREELIAIRLDTLLLLTALLDRSGVVGSVIPRISHSDAHVRARALEVLENTGDVKINRSIISYIEWLTALPLPPHGDGRPALKKEVMVAGSYCASHNKWVAACAEYACESAHAA